MPCSTCSAISSAFKSLSHAAAKSASSRLRSLGYGQTHPEWTRRASACERCPLRTIHNGTSYCGTPYLNKPFRLATDGCGCPTIAKSKDPDEHCPLSPTHSPATTLHDQCTCKWCALASSTAAA